MRRCLVGLSMLAIGCSADTFIGADGSPGDDAAGDAGASDAPSFDVASCAPGWCKGQALQPGSFCTDFDESTALPADWAKDTTTNGFVDFVPSPAEQCLSAHAHLGMVSGTSGTARILHTSTLTGTTSSLHATMMLDVLLPNTNANGLVFFFAIRASGLSIGLAQRTDGSFWLQSSLGTSSLTAPLASQGPKRGTFTHMQLDVIYSPTNVSATLAYNRSDGNSENINAGASAVAIPTQLTYAVGLEAATQTSAAIDAYYDDVITLWQ